MDEATKDRISQRFKFREQEDRRALEDLFQGVDGQTTLRYLESQDIFYFNCENMRDIREGLASSVDKSLILRVFELRDVLTAEVQVGGREEYYRGGGGGGGSTWSEAKYEMDVRTIPVYGSKYSRFERRAAKRELRSLAEYPHENIRNLASRALSAPAKIIADTSMGCLESGGCVGFGCLFVTIGIGIACCSGLYSWISQYLSR